MDGSAVGVLFGLEIVVTVVGLAKFFSLSVLFAPAGNCRFRHGPPVLYIGVSPRG